MPAAGVAAPPGCTAGCKHRRMPPRPAWRRCQRLAPTWEAVTEEIHNKYPEADGRIRLAKVSAQADTSRQAGVR